MRKMVVHETAFTSVVSSWRGAEREVKVKVQLL